LAELTARLRKHRFADIPQGPDRLTLDITKVKTADTTVQLFPPARFIHHRMVQEADVLDDTESGPTGSPGRVKEKHGDV
jgi:hypothetical protein